MPVDRTKLRREIRLGMTNDSTLTLRTKKFAEDVRDYWKNVAWPQATGSVHSPPNHPWSQGGPGSYEESIEVQRRRKRFGLPRYAVVSNHPNANFIEYGTDVDKPGGHSPWGPDTPTPEYHPAASTAFHFGGTAP